MHLDFWISACLDVIWMYGYTDMGRKEGRSEGIKEGKKTARGANRSAIIWNYGKELIQLFFSTSSNIVYDRDWLVVDDGYEFVQTLK